MFRHPVYDEYWQLEDTTRHFDKMNVPSFILGSWYDYMNVGSIESFMGRQHRGGPQARGRQQLVIGPWIHGGVYRQSPEVGELVYPANAPFPVREHMIRWFRFQHLPEHLQAFSRPWAELAVHVCETLPVCAERTVALRKLLEGKDAAVRAALTES